MTKTTKPKTTRKRAPRLNSYRVWFRDGSECVMRAAYPNAVLDLLPVDIRMQVDRIVDAV